MSCCCCCCCCCCCPFAVAEIYLYNHAKNRVNRQRMKQERCESQKATTSPKPETIKDEEEEGGGCGGVEQKQLEKNSQVTRSGQEASPKLMFHCFGFNTPDLPFIALLYQRLWAQFPQRTLPVVVIVISPTSSPLSSKGTSILAAVIRTTSTEIHKLLLTEKEVTA